jgi:hypothetical protein
MRELRKSRTLKMEEEKYNKYLYLIIFNVVR